MSEFFLLGAFIGGLFFFSTIILAISMIMRHRVMLPLSALVLHAIITFSLFISWLAITGGSDIGSIQEADIANILESLYGISLILLFPHFVIQLVHVLILVVKGLSNLKKNKSDMLPEDNFMGRGL